MKEIDIIIQARLSSSRLPGKVLMKLGNLPIIQHIVNNLTQCRGIRHIIIATSNEDSDVPLREYCRENHLLCFAGSLTNVYLRFSEVIQKYKPDAIVRICADSPFLDYRIVEKAVDCYLNNHADMVTNIFPRSYPKGMSVEIVNSETFSDHVESASQESSHREHVTKFFYDNHDNFEIQNFQSPDNLPIIQLSVDTQEDWDSAQRIYNKLDKPVYEYTVNEIISKYSHA